MGYDEKYKFLPQDGKRKKIDFTGTPIEDLIILPEDVPAYKEKQKQKEELLNEGRKLAEHIKILNQVTLNTLISRLLFELSDTSINHISISKDEILLQDTENDDLDIEKEVSEDTILLAQAIAHYLNEHDIKEVITLNKGIEQTQESEDNT